MVSLAYFIFLPTLVVLCSLLSFWSQPSVKIDNSPVMGHFLCSIPLTILYPSPPSTRLWLSFFVHPQCLFLLTLFIQFTLTVFASHSCIFSDRPYCDLIPCPLIFSFSHPSRSSLIALNILPISCSSRYSVNFIPPSQMSFPCSVF